MVGLVRLRKGVGSGIIAAVGKPFIVRIVATAVAAYSAFAVFGTVFTAGLP